MHRFTLPNGLRVLLAPSHGHPRVAVAVHYGVGFRSEPPGREGFAHLFEHLMFQGSAQLAGGEFYDRIHRLGGSANGTTHQDYTDYYQAVPASALDGALFAEADRMRAPLFTEEALAEQLEGVALEIRGTTVERPYGGFPWPLLPSVLYRSYANAHDGYGDPERLRSATVADCRAFFAEHYAPGNAVLTLVGGFDAAEARALVERYFGDIPGRPVPTRPDLRERAPEADRWAYGTEPGVAATAVALGYRLPDPARDLAGYLAHTVLARLLRATGARGGGGPVETSCGFFGPLDALAPETLVVTGLLPPDTAPERFVERVDAGLSHWAEPGAPGHGEAVRTAVRDLALDHVRRHDDLQTRARALGRLELLFGRPGLLAELPDLLADIGPAEVAGAARALRGSARAVLVLAPGPERTRPAPYEAPAAPVGCAGTTGEPVVPAWAETHTPAGTRVVCYRDERTPLAELRIKAPLGPDGWRAPGRIRRLAYEAQLRAGAAWRATGHFGTVQVTTDDQWLEVSGHAPAERAGDWLRTVVGTVLARGTAAAGAANGPAHAAVSAAPAATALQRAADAALRLRLLPGTGDAAALPGPAGAVVVVTGPGDPDATAALVTRTLAGWSAADAVTPEGAAPGPADAYGEDTVLTLHRPGAAEAHVTLCAPAAMSTATEAADYLATAALGGWFGSRLAVDRTPGLTVITGRDMVAAGHRAYLRAWHEGPYRPHTVGELRERVRRLAREPFTAAETDATRIFCAGQVLSVFDAQETLADMLCQTAAYGHDATWLMRLPRALREAPFADVSRAAVRMFAERPLTALAVRTDAVDLTETADTAGTDTDEAARVLPDGRAA
ncbi:M16 family metallopeptidase [Streptomyces sp. NRRL F-4428]|uniref:M16 family metallopeptidase n=1 Tax=Streptomyces sp. NRRL F-4428 TaxID=1609137 RepID=UPI000AC38407|nr:M16 family metallopeptidase [Streptomyces sp. NRRL F-4428]